MTIIYVDNLPKPLFEELLYDATNRISQAGIYTDMEIVEHIEDFKNQRVVDISDSVDQRLWTYAVAIATGVKPKDMEKIYRRYDLQDPDAVDSYAYETFNEAREWLADFWANNPELDEDGYPVEDSDDHVDCIMSVTDARELANMLQGIDYTMDEVTI